MAGSTVYGESIAELRIRLNSPLVLIVCLSGPLTAAQRGRQALTAALDNCKAGESPAKL